MPDVGCPSSVRPSDEHELASGGVAGVRREVGLPLLGRHPEVPPALAEHHGGAVPRIAPQQHRRRDPREGEDGDPIFPRWDVRLLRRRGGGALLVARVIGGCRWGGVGLLTLTHG